MQVEFSSYVVFSVADKIDFNITRHTSNDLSY